MFFAAVASRTDRQSSVEADLPAPRQCGYNPRHGNLVLSSGRDLCQLLRLAGGSDCEQAGAVGKASGRRYRVLAIPIRAEFRAGVLAIQGRDPAEQCTWNDLPRLPTAY